MYKREAFPIWSWCISGTVFAVILGTLVGWVPRLTNAIYPVVKAISTVPPLIYTSYIVLIMPTFFLASLTVVFLSVFWGSFMGSITIVIQDGRIIQINKNEKVKF